MVEAETRKIEWPDDGVSRIPYQIYTDPDNYEDEQRRSSVARSGVSSARHRKLRSRAIT